MDIHSLIEKHPDFCEKHPGLIMNLRFFKRMGRFVQRKPHDFYDKIIWMSLHADTSLWSKLSDKYEVRKYVTERCGEEYLTKLYGVYDRAADIDFDVLPNQYVLKTNNGCGTNILVRSKEQENREIIKEQLAEWLAYPYGAVTGQKHYSAIIPKIIAEELLYQNDSPEDVLVDYKFHCFNGIPTYCQVMSDRKLETGGIHKFNVMLYDMRWEPIPGAFKKSANLKNRECPIELEEMIDVSRKLSAGIPYVRVDLYQVKGGVKFGEMTFMPGFSCRFSESIQNQMGNLITI